MIQILIIVVSVATIAFWWHRFSGQKQQPIAAAPLQRTRPTFHCVEVCAGEPACQSAGQLGNVRYLSGQAPGLPLAGCDAQVCACRYIHHDDRREDDRRNSYGHWSTMPTELKGERRARRDRRSWDGSQRPVMAR